MAVWGLALGWPASMCPISKPTYEQCGSQVSTSFSLSFSFLEGLGEGQESTELLEKPRYREGRGPGLFSWPSHCPDVPCLLILCSLILRWPHCCGQSWPFALNMVCQGKHSPGAQKSLSWMPLIELSSAWQKSLGHWTAHCLWLLCPSWLSSFLFSLTSVLPFFFLHYYLNAFDKGGL